MTRSMDKNRAFHKRARQVLPFGVGSNFRYLGEGNDIGVARAEGAYIWDVDGNRYIDYRLGYGPVILGHGHPVVVDRVPEKCRATGATETPLNLLRRTIPADRLLTLDLER